jgi:hypothetical protein
VADDQEVTDPLERSLRLIVSNKHETPPADTDDPLEAALIRLTTPPTYDGPEAA